MHQTLRARLVSLSLLVASLACVGPHNVFSAAQAAPAGQLAWTNDLSAGLKSAKSTNKWLLLYVYTASCPWCKKLESEVYTNPAVMKTLNKSFVLVKVNYDDPSLGKYVKARFGADGYPQELVLAPNGAVKGKVPGYCPPNDFLTYLSNIITQ